MNQTGFGRKSVDPIAASLGARLVLMENFDSVKISVRDDPEQKLLEMEDIARDLNSFINHPHDRLSGGG